MLTLSTLGHISAKTRRADGIERQNSAVGNNEDYSTAGDVDVTVRRFTASLLTGFVNKINDAAGS
jgi:hypothetical protein